MAPVELHRCNVDWLPPLRKCPGDLGPYLKELYSSFYAEFITTKATFLGLPVLIPSRTNSSGLNEKFVHLTTALPDGKTDESERLEDMFRCERLGWIKPLLADAPSDRARVWREQTRGEWRYGVGLTDFSYVVHLAERDKYFQLITAYCVEGNRRREKFSDQWKRYKSEARK